jgi:peptidoglycan/LPS O-acetylase OafA/YrhL
MSAIVVYWTQYVLRPYFVTKEISAPGVLGSLPSLITAFAIPYLCLLVGSEMRSGARPLLRGVLAGSLALILLEVLQIHGTESHFDWMDLLAIIVGTCLSTAVILRWILVR